MLSRQQQLLKKIVQIYIKTAEPVGSLYLADKFGGVSSATIRNEMMELEQEGYIHQPHTSAGRVPTEKGFRFFVENCVSEAKADKSLRQKFLAVSRQEKGEEKIKELARLAAETAEEAVIVAFDPRRLYFTGLSHLFSKPEFSEQARVTSVSEILDHCEEVMPRVLELISNGKKILIGKENPFGTVCSFISMPMKDDGMFGLLGPMRMDYEKNRGIIEMIEELL